MGKQEEKKGPHLCLLQTLQTSQRKKGRKKKSLVSLILVCDWMEFELQTAIPTPWRDSKRYQNGALLYNPKES